MLTMPLRRQGGAAIITIPPSILKRLELELGASLAMDVKAGKLILTPDYSHQKQVHKRRTAAQLLKGITPTVARAMIKETEWARLGDAVGHELT